MAKKLSCWVCGRDLTFNAVRAQAGAFVVHLFCKRCRRPRRMELHLHPADVAALLGTPESGADEHPAETEDSAAE